MRMRRMVAEGVGYYHVISRIAGQQFLVDDQEKDVLMRLMFDVAVFSGVVYSRLQLATGVDIATRDTPSQRQAQVAARTMIELMNLETAFRDVAYMERTERCVNSRRGRAICRFAKYKHVVRIR